MSHNDDAVGVRASVELRAQLTPTRVVHVT
jgi:hypothetical protein